MIRAETGQIAIIGGGGREHVLAEQYAKDDKVKALAVLPGNDFIKYDIEQRFGKSVEINPSVILKNPDSILAGLGDTDYDLVDVAQDNAIAGDIAGHVRREGGLAFAPDANAGRLESDKSFFRSLGSRAGIPQPQNVTVYDDRGLEEYLDTLPEESAFYAKASGLAEGKGAVSAKDKYELRLRVQQLRKDFPQAAEAIVIEEWLRNFDGTPGEEFSAFFATDGLDSVYLGTAVDYKRANDNDTGENTGSMGSNSPTNIMSGDLLSLTKDSIVNPLLNQMTQEDLDYQGVLYVSGMRTRDASGRTKVNVIEMNSRLGDPEAQVVLPGMTNSYRDFAMAVATRDLGGITVNHDGRSRVAVTGASRGYPGNYDQVKGKEVTGLEDVRSTNGTTVYGAGMELRDNKWLAKGGRLFYVVGEGDSTQDARERAYEGMSYIDVDGENLHHRSDIGMKDIRRTNIS